MTWLQWYFRPRHHASLREKRWYLVGMFWFPLVGGIHVGVLGLALLLHVTPLIWANLCFSIPAFAVAAISLRLGREGLAFRIGTLELLVHAAVGVHAIGWSSGVQLPLFAAPLLLGSRAHRAERFAVAGIVIVELLYLRTLGPPAVALDSTVLAVIFAVSALVAVGVTAYLVIGLDGASTDLEIALVRERERSEELLRREVAYQVAERSRELGASLALPGAALDARRLSIGERFAERYEVVAPLGEGGMGAVYEVRRTTDAARLALKAISGEVNSLSAARFAREAEIGARVRHPNLVSIVDVGVSEGVPYLVMELVRGTSLDSCSDRFGDVTWALPILQQIVDGLAALHVAGIVHRDLKPANVLLSFDVAKPTAKISDFGISGFGVAAFGAGPASQLTGTGMLLGTPLYMAPETGSTPTPDASADIFALGVLAFELVSARRPFATPAIMLAMSGSLPVPAFLPDDPSPALHEHIIACLAEDPARRPGIQALRAILGSHITHPVPDHSRRG